MKSVRVYKYRWLVLLAIMLLTIASSFQWLALAPISRAAMQFYKGQIPERSIIGPDLLTLIHMVVFLIASIPASFVIGKIGLKYSLRFAALLIAVFSLIKGFGAANFNLVLISQIGLALAHPIVFNSVTAVTARWFPLRERGFATGLVSFSQYLGLLLVMIISPQSVVTRPQVENYGQGIASLLFWYGIATAVISAATILLFKEKPATPASNEPYHEYGFRTSYRILFHKKHMAGLTIVFGLIWGLFIAFISKVDGITALIGIENSNGIIGAVLLIAGMLGSVVIPAISDYTRKRKKYFIISITGIFVGFISFAVAPLIVNLIPEGARIIAIVFSGVLGFFFMGAIPLGFQYASELSYPAPESASQGILLLGGYLTGTIVLLFMILQGGAYLEAVLIASVVSLFATFLAAFFIKESPVIITEDERLRQAVDKEFVVLE